MANTDKNLVITPNRGQTADPKIVFSGADASTAAQNITLQVYPTNNGTLSFEGSAGQLFSITNTLSGSIFSVNDVSGIPSIEVLDTGLVKIAQYSGNILFGGGTDDTVNKVQITGSLKATSLISTVATGTSPLTVTSTTLVTNLNADSVDGAHVDTAYNSYGNGTIPKRHSSGYLFSQYFNTTADITSSTSTHFAIQIGDNYIRWRTPANIKTDLGINNVTNISLSNIFNNSGNTHGVITDFNSIPDFGCNHVLGTTNGPSVAGATQYFSWAMGLGAEYSYSQYVCQFAIPRVPTGGDQTLSVRFRDGGTWMAWNPVIANVRKKPITYISKSGHNSIGILIDGRLFTSCGNSTNNANNTTGRHATGAAYVYALDNMKEVAFPETTAKITSSGGYGNSYAYALFDNGNLYTWGLNGAGQCGVGNTTAQPYPVLATTNVSAVYSHPTCGEYSMINRLIIKKTDGYLYGAGSAAHYNFGLGNTTQQTSFVQMTGATINTQKCFNLGADAGCTIVLTSDGRILACGYNNYGQLGNASSADVQTFTDITSWWTGYSSGILDLKVCFYGGYHNGAAATWISTIVMLITLPNSTKIVRASGYGVNGQLGDGTTVSKTSPVTVLNSTNVIDISLSGIGTCHMLKSDNTIWGWGYNVQGGVGNGTSTDVSTPVQVLTSASKLLSDGLNCYINGHLSQSYFVKTDGTLWACGFNDTNRYIPTGTSVTNVTTPSKIIIPNNETVVEIGHSTSYNAGRTVVARTSSENLYAWGYNGNQTITNLTGAVISPSTVPLPNFN